ncbi:MAG: hypothetical protein VSS75_019695 [Candidatus Parabeggiatoa sp.]
MLLTTYQLSLRREASRFCFEATQSQRREASRLYNGNNPLF